MSEQKHGVRLRASLAQTLSCRAITEAKRLNLAPGQDILGVKTASTPQGKIARYRGILFEAGVWKSEKQIERVRKGLEAGPPGRGPEGLPLDASEREPQEFPQWLLELLGTHRLMRSISIQSSVGQMEVDALYLAGDVLYVGEVKLWMVVDGQTTSPTAMGSALDQCAAYILALREIFAEHEVDLTVSEDVFLINPRDTGSRAVVTWAEVSSRVMRQADVLASLGSLEEVYPPDFTPDGGWQWERDFLSLGHDFNPVGCAGCDAYFDCWSRARQNQDASLAGVKSPGSLRDLVTEALITEIDEVSEDLGADEWTL